MSSRLLELERADSEQPDDGGGRFSILELLAASWVVGVCAYYYWELGYVALAGHLLGVGK
ncbi:hypothetical protein ACFL6X_01775 [Candidatus Latescibacterota bacterium]